MWLVPCSFEHLHDQDTRESFQFSLFCAPSTCVLSFYAPDYLPPSAYLDGTCPMRGAPCKLQRSESSASLCNCRRAGLQPGWQHANALNTSGLARGELFDGLKSKEHTITIYGFPDHDHTRLARPHGPRGPATAPTPGHVPQLSQHPGQAELPDRAMNQARVVSIWAAISLALSSP